jgi:hypothetical protein
MSFRCKFVTHTIELIPAVIHRGVKGMGTYSVTARPVVGDTKSSSGWDASPAGSLYLCSLNKTEAAQYEVGKEFYLTCAPCEKEVE